MPPETVIVNVGCALRLVGSGTDETSLREHAEPSSARERIMFAGAIDEDRSVEKLARIFAERVQADLYSDRFEANPN
jgi:hypothetical protein